MSAALVACGGGSSSVGPPPASPAASLSSQIDSPTNAQGQDDTGVAGFWDDINLKAYVRDGRVTGYWNEEFQGTQFKLTYAGFNDSKDSARLKLQHTGHSAQLNDRVTISGVTFGVAGVSKESLSRTFEISPAPDGSYEILVPPTASPGLNVTLNATLKYRYKECTGKQTVSQTALIKNDQLANGTQAPAISFNSIKASRVEQKVSTTLNGCSPAKSEFFTTRYFPYDPRLNSGPLYPLIGQVVKDGDFSLVDSFTLPPNNLQAGDKGAMGVIANYADFKKQIRTGRTLLRYEVLKHTTQSVFVALISENYDAKNVKLSEMTDYYGKTPSIVGSSYSLIRTTVKYSNARNTELSVDYDN